MFNDVWCTYREIENEREYERDFDEFLAKYGYTREYFKDNELVMDTKSDDVWRRDPDDKYRIELELEVRELVSDV